MLTVKRFAIKTPNLHAGQVPVGLTEVANGKYMLHEEHEAVIKELGAGGSSVSPESITALEEKVAELETIQKNLSDDLQVKNEECENLKNDLQKNESVAAELNLEILAKQSSINDLQSSFDDLTKKHSDLLASLVAPSGSDALTDTGDTSKSEPTKKQKK